MPKKRFYQNTQEVTLKNITALTPTQKQVFRSYNDDKHLLLYGSAGSGKSFLALYLGLRDVFNEVHEKVIVVRSIVPSRDIGHLPGTLQEKIAIYEQPYKSICSELLGKTDSYESLKQNRKIEFLTTSFVRGITLDNAIVILDEIQNYTDAEINSVLTRIGQNTRVIISGDFEQNDLDNQRKRETSGLAELMKTVKKMKSFDVIKFEINDIVRSGFVKEYLIARSTIY